MEPLNRTETVKIFGITLYAEIGGTKDNPQVTITDADTNKQLTVFTWFDENILIGDCDIDEDKPATKERTCEKCRKQIENHIVPKLGEYDLEELTAQVLQRFTAELSESGLAANTVNGIISVLKSSLKRAVMLGITNVQCSDAIVRPKAKEKQVESFTKGEQRKMEGYIVEKGKDKLFDIVLCLYTGLLIGELLALTWQDVDFGKGIIAVNKSCRDAWRDGKYVKGIDTPKTENGYRIVPIPKQLVTRLKEIKKHSVGEYIIGGKAEYGAQIRSYQRTFEKLLIKLGIAHKGFHALRHTFATRALEVGMDVKTLSELLGHGNPMITLKRYAHSKLEHKTEMMNRVGRLLLQ